MFNLTDLLWYGIAIIAVVFVLYPLLRILSYYIRGKMHRVKAINRIKRNHVLSGGKSNRRFLLKYRGDENLSIIDYYQFIELLQASLRTYIDNFFNIWKGKHNKIYSFWENVLQFLLKNYYKIARFSFFKDLAGKILGSLVKLYDDIHDKTSFVIALIILIIIFGDSFFLQIWIREANFIHLQDQSAKFWAEITAGFFMTSILSILISAWFLMFGKIITPEKTEVKSKSGVIIFSILSGIIFFCIVGIVYLRANVPSENPQTNWFLALFWGAAAVGIGYLIFLQHKKLVDGIKIIAITVLIILVFPICAILYLLHLMKIIPLALLFPLIRIAILLGHMALKQNLRCFSAYDAGLGPEASLSEPKQDEFDRLSELSFTNIILNKEENQQE